MNSLVSLKYQLPSRLYGDSLQMNVTLIWIFPDDLLISRVLPESSGFCS